MRLLKPISTLYKNIGKTRSYASIHEKLFLVKYNKITYLDDITWANAKGNNLTYSLSKNELVKILKRGSFKKNKLEDIIFYTTDDKNQTLPEFIKKLEKEINEEQFNKKFNSLLRD